MATDTLDQHAIDIVRRGYDSCADAYGRARAGAPAPVFEALAARLQPGTRILDIGCGCGVPVTAALAQQFRVAGVDLSAEQVRRARAAVARADFIEGDIMAVEFADGTFDGIVAFYSVFHLPRDRHRALFGKVAGWLVPGGLFLATLTEHAEPGYTEADFFGTEMYWSHYGRDDYHRMLAEVGFEVLQTTSVGHGYAFRPDLPPETHPVVLARRRRHPGE